MSKLRITYIASLVVLAVLIAATLLHPIEAIGEYSQVQREQLLRTENEWIVEFDIINHEGKEQEYTIIASVDGKQYPEDVSILDGRIFTYIRHIRHDKVENGDVCLSIYRKDEDVPLEQVTYYLK